MKKAADPVIFAERVAAISFFEWKGVAENAHCLVIGEGKECEALLKLLSSRCQSADKTKCEGKIYDIIFLMQEFDRRSLRDAAGENTLLVDAAINRTGMGYFDPKLPFRQVRVIAVDTDKSSDLMQELQ